MILPEPCHRRCAYRSPIPGKPAVGIEVPNKIRSTVSIRGVFESQNYINMRSPLTMALGKDIAGTAQVADLCKNAPPC